MTHESGAEKTSAYKEATDAFYGGHRVSSYYDRVGLEWFQGNIKRLKPALFDRVIRGEILRGMIDLNQGNEAGDILESNPDALYMMEGNPFVAIAREVITRIAITYFGHLKGYLQARESVVTDPEIEKIREKVAESATILLQELEAIIPNFKQIERTDDEAKKYVQADLHMVIDTDRVARESGFYNVFKVSDIHNFEGTNADGESCGMNKNKYSGLRLIDVLFLWNPSSDVALREREGEETKPFAVIHKDGTVDVNLERCTQIKSGMDMTLEKVPDEERDNLVEQIAFSSGARDVDSVMETLTRNDLLPKWMVRFGNSTVYLSDKLYTNEMKKGERTYTTIYVKDDKKGLVVRSCYRSLSHAVWKLLPAYYDDAIEWFHKGDGEEQIVLPPEIQRALLYLCTTEQMKDAKLVLHGAVREFRPAQSFREEIEAIPLELGTGFRHEVRGNKKVDPKSPESFQFHDENDKPNFSQIIGSWTEETALYGTTTFDVFPSQNGRLRYVFCHDMRGRAWIGGIDIKDEGLTSQGIKKQWVRAGDLCTPVFDYWEQADGYENDDLVAGHKNQYVDMYANYISHIPLIKKYQAWVSGKKDT